MSDDDCGQSPTPAVRTLADLIDAWHASEPGSPLRLARALSLTGPVLDRCAIYSGEYHAPDTMTIRWDASDAMAELKIEEGPDGVVRFLAGAMVSEEEISRRWGVPLARDVAVPEAS